MAFNVTKHVGKPMAKVVKSSTGKKIAKDSCGPQYEGGKCSYTHGSGQAKSTAINCMPGGGKKMGKIRNYNGPA